jgi:hypothetical protein
MVSILVTYLLLGFLVTLVFSRFDTTPPWGILEFCTCCVLWPLGLFLVLISLLRRKVC